MTRSPRIPDHTPPFGPGPEDEPEAARRPEGWFDLLLAGIARSVSALPRWLVLANLSTFTVLGWWVTMASERSDRTSHVGSILVLVLGLALTMVATALAGAVHELAEMERRTVRWRSTDRFDPLTGVLSRDGITAEVTRRLDGRSDDGVIGVLFCDIDRLRVVNDSLGHFAGDQVLQIVAARLAGALRTSDAVGRFGGDKFVIVTSGLPTTRDLEILADRLIDSLSNPVELADGSRQAVSCSIGIAWTADSSAGSVTTDSLLRDAGSAMNLVKAAGGAGQAMFDPDVRARAVARLQLEQELRRGVDVGEIVVHYQPIVDAATGDADRYEALVRWQHPRRGMVHPADFLAVAGESSLIVEIGELVLETACRQALAWSEESGHPVTVAVNMSQRQLLDPDVVGSVSRILAETGLPPQCLELEIAEELLADQIEQTLLALRQLDLLGVGLAIDDFGTSQASLARLHGLNMVSTLKVDRVFVEGLGDESIDRSIVAAVVDLADRIGMSVVAEGVEQLEQSRILSELGVRLHQGFLYQRPGPPEVMERHIQRLAQRPARLGLQSVGDSILLPSPSLPVADDD